MAIPSLLGSYIDETYQRVVQYQGGEFADGTGSAITFGGGTPAGPVNSIQYKKDATNFSGSSNLTFVDNNINLTGSILMSGSSYISEVDYIDFDIIATSPTQKEGRLFWNTDSKTLQLDLEQNFHTDLNQQMLVRVVNKTGADVPIASVVFISGSQGQRPGIKLASYESDLTSATTIGFTAKTINNNNNGYVVTRGILDGLNTSTYSVGDRLFLSSSGTFTNVVPDAPLHEVRLGKVIVSDAINGSIYVDIMNGYELDELHDVKATNPNYGDLFMYSSSLWIATKRLSGSYELTGSLTASIIIANQFTGSLQGTASWATDAITSYTPISTTGSTIYSTSPATSFVNPTNGIFLGGGAGNVASKADYGVFLGYRAGYTATTASEAVFIGPTAGENASKADHSVFIGTGAGRDAISASYSTIIGAYAGWAPSPSIGVGTNNIIVGNYVTLPDGAKNSINVGGIIFATGSYSSFGTVYSGSQYNIGRVGINKVTPIYTLDVSGSGNYSNGLIVTGSLIAATITGSLQGTATNANTASLSSRPIAFTGSTIYSTSPSSATFNTQNQNNNIFLGTNAGYSSVTNFPTASYCIFLGASAGSGVQRLNNSVFIGDYSGYLANYAINSIFIGSNAGNNASSASGSIFLGYYAGGSSNAAAYSTILGYKAGFIPYAGGSKSVGPNNIIIGTNISLPLDRRDSINIGGIIFGTGSYSTITNIETDAYTGSADGRIGINVVNPTFNFEVSGTVGLKTLTNVTQTNVVSIDSGTGQLYYQSAGTSVTAATPDEITLGAGGTIVVEPENLEQSKYTTVNIFNFLNFS